MQRKKPFSYEEFKTIYSKVPRLCVDLIIKTEAGLVLIERKQDGWEGMWHLPGGTVHYKEKALEAVKRIGKEELGADIGVEGFVGFIEYPTEEKIRGFGWSVSLAFLVNSLEKLPEKNEEGESIRIFKDLPEKIVSEQKDFLEGFLNHHCDDPECKEHL